jgi:hypothetical protein
MKQETFTMIDALEVQRRNLLQWKQILKQDAYEALLMHVASANAKGYKSPYDVIRGSDISQFMQNYMMNETINSAAYQARLKPEYRNK